MPGLPRSDVLTRRDLLCTGLAATAATLVGARSDCRASSSPTEVEDRIITVSGPIRSEELGLTLPYEHVLVDFIGADRVDPSRYDADEAFEAILPHLREFTERGGRTIAECTPAYLGRDPRLLKRLADASGVQILTNTGYYAARRGKFLPRHAFEESANHLADRWEAEAGEGIDNTGIRPGFIKVGVDGGPLPPVSRTIVAAAARTHLRTGLSIVAHTGGGQAHIAAREQLAILEAEGVSPNAWVWTHAQNEPDRSHHVELARRGAWISLDHVTEDATDQYVAMITNLAEADLLDRTLISHDAGWYRVGEPGGGRFRGYNAIFDHLLPALRAAVFTAAEIERLTVTNPAKLFTVRAQPA